MKVLLLQLNMVVGDLGANTDKIIEGYLRYADEVDLVVTSELAISGYPPLDIVEYPTFIEQQDFQLQRLYAATEGKRAKLAVGHVAGSFGVNGHKLTNSMTLISNGVMGHFDSKHLLPTYGIFDEARHFKPGETNQAISLCGQKVGFLICEDIWNDKDGAQTYPYNPVEELVRHGAKTIISLNASPSNVGKFEQRMRLAHDLCTKNGVNLIYVNQVGANDDIVFDGGSFVMNKLGIVVDQAPRFREAWLDVDMDTPRNIFEPVSSRVRFLYDQLILGISDYAEKCGFTSAVVGSSGGIDSAVMLALAAKVFGPENTFAITMPTQYSSSGSVDDSVALCRNLGVKLFNFPIKELFTDFQHSFLDRISIPRGTEPMTMGLEWENVQPRLRGMALMAFANRYGSLLLSTGNKSEMSVGYCTLYGDMCGGLAPLADIYKMEVFDLARHINEREGREIVPLAIIDKEPSAELAPGQKDTDSLPPYPVLDAILRIYIEGPHLSTEEIGNHTSTILEYCENKEGAVEELFKRIAEKVDRAEFKRRQAPPTIRCHSRAFGFGRRLPIAQKFRA